MKTRQKRSINIKSAEFLTSSPSLFKCPDPGLPEFAFIGRSNVGKSSLINCITGRKNLAKISGKPGKTRLINYFIINKQWALVDLPGYGWAGVSKSQRQEFRHMIKDYLMQRQPLICTFILLDIRHPPQSRDLEFIRWMGTHQLPFVLVFTKADKVSKNQQTKSVELFTQVMLVDWEYIPRHFVTSSNNGLGREELLTYLQELAAMK